MVEGVCVRLNRRDLPVGGLEFSDQVHRLLMVILQKLCSSHTILPRTPPGTHRFQRAVSAKDVLIGMMRPRSRLAYVRRLLLAPLRIRLQARYGTPMGLQPTPARSQAMRTQGAFFLHIGRQPLCLMAREAAHRGARIVWNAI